MKTSTQNHRARVKPQRILVPVDFSDPSASALRYAAKRAAETGGSLIVVHVVPADYGWLQIGRDELRDLDRSLQRQAADRMRAFADENIPHNVAADLEVRIGQPAEQIVAAGRESKCDSIILSTRGLTGLDRYLIGSVAHRVAQLAPCPVVLLRPGKDAGRRKQKGPAVLRIKREGKTSR
ncbi:MAG TPA: universal stress protein [Candidatus Udaeobacter sp.]|jgi:nucleotide-binding universal stress UspA family protein|nr:universal stress protein [Candidatus Udaeobacter sp.]